MAIRQTGEIRRARSCILGCMSSGDATITIMGAGGKMGCRITDNFIGSPHRVHHVEVSPAGRENLRRRGLEAVPEAEAVPAADVVILAVPDNLIERIAGQVVPRMKSGATLIALDPAAPCAGKLPARADVAYVACHPCHPSVFNDESDPEARRDFFGGVRARQDVVCALIQGPEAAYAAAEPVCRRMFAPVEAVHHVTIEQMAILEPALSETTIATCIVTMKEAVDEAVRRGVPAAAARAFALGHINVILAIVFGEIGAPLSEGARKAVERARSRLFKPDWKQVFEPADIHACIDMITAPPPA